MSHRRWIDVTRAASAGGLAVYAVGTLASGPGGPLEDFLNHWLYVGLMLLACVVVGSRAYLEPRERPAWAAFTAACASWTFGEIYFVLAQPETAPSLGDVGYLAFYPLVYVGMVALLRSHVRAIGGTLWLDGMTASLAAGALAAAVLVEVVLESTEGSTANVVTNLAYPLGDVLLLSAVFGVFALTGWTPGLRWLLLGAGVLATALADAVYLFQSAAGTYVEGTWIDILWPTALLAIAAAAWAEDRSATLRVEGRPLLAVPAACALLGIGILVYDHFDRLNLLALVLSTLALLAVVVRLAATFRDNNRLYELTKHESVTDALTGLANRRRLLTDLERTLAAEKPRATLFLMFDLDGFKSYNDTYGHPAGDALLARLGVKLAEVPGRDGMAYRLGGDEFCLIAPVADGDAEGLIDRACAALTESGEGFEVGSSFGAVLLPEEATDASQALRLADERLYAQKHARRIETDRMMDALLEALSLREPDLPLHLDSVGSHAVQIGQALDLRPDELQELVRAAQLHDLGKLAIPDEILHKAEALDEGEWAFVRQHPLVGERILRASPAFRSVATIVRSTHERWDGGGYPDGLEAEEIPLASRILAVCDAFTAMISHRPYRAALSEHEALAELARLAGTQFDPAVVRLLAAAVRERLRAREPA
jgi:two-component system, cell cycle response regulator